MTHTESLTAEQTFGGQVREAREAREWSQETLARKLREDAGLELHQTAIARLERGDRTIRLNEAIVLARLLNLNLGAYAGVPVLDDEQYQKLVEGLEQVNRSDQELMQRQAELESELAQVRERRANLESVRRGMLNTLAHQEPRDEA